MQRLEVSDAVRPTCGSLGVKRLISNFPHEILKECVYIYIYIYMGNAVAQWLRCCAANRKVAGSIPAGVIGIFH